VFRSLARPVNLAVLVAAAVAAFALVDLLYARALPFIGWVLSRIGPARAYRYDIGLALVLVIAVIGAGVVVSRRTTVPEARGLAGSETFELPGDPMGIVMRTTSAGYASLGEGMVIQFELPRAGGELSTKVVADGFEYPRGLAIAAGRLYVADLVGLPCDPPYPVCTAGSNPDKGYAAQDKIVRSARGRLVSFAIGSDGTLTDRRTDLEGLPVAGTEHGVNGVETGPDGAIYVSIGNVGELTPPISTDMTPHPEWFGTVLRVDPATNVIQVFASGLRNVYELAFDPKGGLWGIDNDGTTLNGFRGEEVLQLKQGGNYGYPADGTFGTRTVRNVEPIWMVQTSGTAGLAWAEGTPLGSGLIYGSCNGLDFLGMFRRANGEPIVANPESLDSVNAKLLDIPGCIDAVTVLPDGSALIGVFAFTGHGSLMRLTFKG
jgi:glucose/sorbosone dehydrogenase